MKAKQFAATKMSSVTRKEAITQELVNQLEETLRLLRTSIPQEWFTTELTMPQLRGLFVLLRAGPSRMGVLASHLGISVSSATALADKLVDKWLVERWPDQEDRRSVICTISPKGRELAERLLQLRRSEWEAKMENLSEEDLSAATQGLKPFLQGLCRTSGATQHEENDAEAKQHTKSGHD